MMNNPDVLTAIFSLCLRVSVANNISGVDKKLLLNTRLYYVLSRERPMKERHRYLIVSIFAAATLSYGAMLYQNAIFFWRDSVYGAYIELADTVFPFGATNGTTIVSDSRYKRYVPEYRDLPPGFIHAGGLLLFAAGVESDLDDVAAEAMRYTGYVRASTLKNDIRKFNGLSGGEIPAGSAVVIPGANPSLMTDIRNRALPPLFESRGLYFSGTAAGTSRILDNLDRYRELGINTIVFDAKDIPGIVNYHSRVPEVREYGTDDRRTIDNIERFIRILKEKGFYSVARIAVFHDHLLRKRDPRLAIRSRHGGAWNPGSKEKWCDPTNRRVQDYNIAIATELAGMGVDEIQFDYLRFPTGGDRSDADYRYDFGRMSHDAVITHFLSRAHRAVAARKARLSIDIFGVVAWGKSIDIEHTGQRIELLARHCDVISPMLYPSHFNDDFDGYARPGDNPYYFINNGCRKVIELSGKHAIVRPWLQAFRWRVSHYNRRYIVTQIKATNDSGAKGYLFWNAANDYGTVLNALEDIKSGAADREPEKAE